MKISRNHHALKQIKINIPPKITRYSKNNVTKIRQKFNKPDLRAKGLSLLSLALRPGLLGATALAMSFVVTSPTSAASITLTVPDSPLSVNIGPDKSFNKSAPATVSVKTDSLSGYRLTISSKNGDNKLKNNTDTDELVSLPDDVMTETKTGITEDEFSKNPTYINNWGYQPSKLNGNNNNLFIPGPKASLTVINTTKSQNIEPDTYTFAIAAKTDSSAQNGAYSNTFVLCGEGNGNGYTITYKSLDEDGRDDESVLPAAQSGTAEGKSVQLSSENPTKENSKFMGWCSVEPTDNNTDNPTCKGGLYQPGNELALCDGGNNVTLWAVWEKTGEYMQNWEGCAELTPFDQGGGIIKLTDIRDKSTYNVAKLKDGKCWMVENLKIGYKTLTPDDSDVSSNYTVPSSNLESFGLGSSGSQQNTNPNNEANYIDPIYGGYYTFQTATAGTGNLATNGKASGSICPKGWHLPTGGPGGEFSVLNNAYGGFTDTSAQLIATPAPGFSYNGQIPSSSPKLHVQGTTSYYWSSTAFDYAQAYDLALGSTYTYTENKYPRSFGFSVRCLQN